MRFTLIDPDDSRWTDFLARSDHDVYHKPGYVRLLGRERKLRACACFGESDSAAMLLPLLLDRLPEELGLPEPLWDGRSPDGYPAPLFVGNDREVPKALENLVSFLRENRIVACFIRTHPLLGIAPDAFRTIGEVVDRGVTVPIFLDAPYGEILLRMRQGHRYEIRRARKRGCQVAMDRWELLPLFVRLYRGLMDRVGADSTYRFSEEYFSGFRAAVGDSAHLAFAFNEADVPTAGAIFTSNDGIVQYHLAVTDPAFKGDAAQKLVVDEIIRWGIEQNARAFHLGGGVGARSDSLLRFKAGFSNEALPYRTVHVVSDLAAMRSAGHAWRERHPGRQPNREFFPAYRARPAD